MMTTECLGDNYVRIPYGFKNPDIWSDEEKKSAENTLFHWLKHDSWSYEEALLLILGIRPNVAEFFDVIADGYKTYFIQAWVTIYGEQLRIENAQVRLPKLLKMISENSADGTDVHGFVNSDAYALSLVAEYRKTKSLWLSGNHPEQNSIGYYFQWANSKGIAVPWLGWAIEHELYKHAENTNDQTRKIGVANSVYTKDIMLDDKSLLMLKKIFLANLDAKDLLDAKRFRADHFDNLARLDSLETSGYVDRRDNKYSLNLIALPVIAESTPQVIKLLELCEQLFNTLRLSYQEKLGEGVSISDLVKKTGQSRQQVVSGILYMIQAPQINGGHTSDLFQDDAYVMPSEGVLKYRTFTQVVQEIQDWYSKGSSVNNNQTSEDMFAFKVGHEEIKFDLLLHSIINEHALQKFKDGHLRNAVLDSVIAVFDLIRIKTGLHEDGDELIGKAFSLAEPYLILSEIDTESGKNDQKGFIQILKGVYQGVRNPQAHSLVSDLNQTGAAQYLVLASLLARRIEEAQLVKKND